MNKKRGVITVKLLKTDSLAYELGHFRAKLVLGGHRGRSFFAKGYLTEFCARDFERITGYKLKVGECKKIRIHIEEVE